MTKVQPKKVVDHFVPKDSYILDKKLNAILKAIEVNPITAEVKDNRLHEVIRNQSELLNELIERLDKIDTNMDDWGSRVGGNNQGLQEVQKGIREISIKLDEILRDAQYQDKGNTLLEIIGTSARGNKDIDSIDRRRGND